MIMQLRRRVRPWAWDWFSFSSFIVFGVLYFYLFLHEENLREVWRDAGHSHLDSHSEFDSPVAGGQDAGLDDHPLYHPGRRPRQLPS